MDRFGRDKLYNIAPKPARIDAAPWRNGDPLAASAIMFVPVDETTWVEDFSGYQVRARLDYSGECCDDDLLFEEIAVVGGAQGVNLTATEGDYMNTRRNQVVHGLLWAIELPSSFTDQIERKPVCLTVQTMAAGDTSWKTAFIFKVPSEYGC